MCKWLDVNTRIPIYICVELFCSCEHNISEGIVPVDLGPKGQPTVWWNYPSMCTEGNVICVQYFLVIWGELPWFRINFEVCQWQIFSLDKPSNGHCLHFEFAAISMYCVSCWNIVVEVPLWLVLWCIRIPLRQISVTGPWHLLMYIYNPVIPSLLLYLSINLLGCEMPCFYVGNYTFIYSMHS